MIKYMEIGILNISLFSNYIYGLDAIIFNIKEISVLRRPDPINIIENSKSLQDSLLNFIH